MSQTAQVARRVVSPPARPVDELPPDGVPSPEELGASEDDILRSLDAAAEVDTQVIAIVRQGRTVLRFKVQSCTQKVYDDCRNDSLIKEKASGYGNVRLNVDVDRTGFNSRLIYHATTDEDRERIWRNRTAWRKYNVLNGWDLIAKVLRNFEMERVCERIDVLSGAAPEIEAQQLELAGNS